MIPAREVLHLAFRADAVREVDLGVFHKECLELMPGTLGVPDLLAPGADRQDTAQALYFRQGVLRSTLTSCCSSIPLLTLARTIAYATNIPN